MSILKISANEILNIIKEDIPFDNLVKNSGIYETRTLFNTLISIGVTYEDKEVCNDETPEEIYFYNLFVDETYIEISEYGNKKDRIPDAVINKILSEISDVEL